jgi:hypothetical protein
MNGNDMPLVVAIRGPITVLTVGVLFVFNNFTPYGIERTWPVILIVFGVLSLLRRSIGPVGAPQPSYPYNAPPPTPPPPGPYAAPPVPPQPVTYNPPPPVPDRGGFGTTVPPKPATPAESVQPPTGQGGTL